MGYAAYPPPSHVSHCSAKLISMARTLVMENLESHGILE